MSACREDAAGFTAHQALYVRRGDCDPFKVVEFSRSDPLPDPFGLCPLFGQVGWGDESIIAGALQRLGVSPDGSAVVFEVTDDFAFLPLVQAPAEDEGIFVVRSDGSGLRRLGPPSREASFRIVIDPNSPVGFATFPGPVLAVSPNGRLAAFTDRGPGPSGEDAIQIMIIDLTDGMRRQLTHLPTGTSPVMGYPETCCPSFVDDRTISFLTATNPDGANPNGDLHPFSIETDGNRLRSVATPSAGPDSQVVPTFQIIGASSVGRRLATLVLPGMVENPELGDGPVNEAFLVEGKKLLQLTNFRYSDTGSLFIGPGGSRALLSASADPLGMNPSHNCQIFSVDTFGGHLRQLTRFAAGERSTFGCGVSLPPGCFIASVTQAGGTMAFESSCDPLGSNPSGGEIFVMRSSGGKLRQLTDTLGLVADEDGVLSVELPGPFAHSGR